MPAFLVSDPTQHITAIDAPIPVHLADALQHLDHAVLHILARRIDGTLRRTEAHFNVVAMLLELSHSRESLTFPIKRAVPRGLSYGLRSSVRTRATNDDPAPPGSDLATRQPRQRA